MEQLAPLRQRPEASAILSDIDGTLAPIVRDPDAATVPADAREVLRALAERYALVGCLSGRSALEARRIVGLDQLAYAGNHGFEMLVPGAEEPALDAAVLGRESIAR
jgi:trehalose 6-phosphate phosphatase